MPKLQKLFIIPLAIAFLANVAMAQEEKKDDKVIEKGSAALVGNFKGDKEMTAKGMEKEGEEFDENLVNMVLETVGQISVNFKKDNTFEVSMSGQEMSGDWEVKKAKKKKDVYVLEVYTETSEGEEKNFSIEVSKKHIKMTDLDDGGPTICFKRQAKDKDKDK